MVQVTAESPRQLDGLPNHFYEEFELSFGPAAAASIDREIMEIRELAGDNPIIRLAAETVVNGRIGLYLNLAEYGTPELIATYFASP